MSPPIGSARAGLVSQVDAIPDSDLLQARYDARGITASDGDLVTTWADESGNGYDLTAGTAPTYKTGIINNNPVVRFDGSSTFLDVAWSSAVAEGYYVFAVFIKRSSGGNQSLFDGDSNREHVFGVAGDTNNWQLDQGENLDSGIGENTNPHIGSALFESGVSGESDAIRIDGTLGNSGDIANVNSSGLTVGARAGGSKFGPYDVGELLFYYDKPSVGAVETYLSDKWEVAI